MGLLSPLASVQQQEAPDGFAVLSMCSGIGGVEVALHKLEVRVRKLVYVEIDDGCSAVRNSSSRCFVLKDDELYSAPKTVTA